MTLRPGVTLGERSHDQSASDPGTLRADLRAARTRTLALLEDLDDAQLRAQHSPLMSPMVWDLAHIANYEELWLLRAIDGRPPVDEAYDDLYDAFEHPRRERRSLPILDPDEARAYAAEVRNDVVELLGRTDLSSGPRLVANGRVHRMVIQHEHQHDETLLATRQLMADASAPPHDGPAPSATAPAATEVLLPGGHVTMGTDTDPWSYDNERPAHTVDVAPFWIDTTPVSNAAYLAFVDAGGYRDRRTWSDEGWAWREREDAQAPLFWIHDGSTWQVERFGERAAVSPGEPVMHVSWHEAEAYARWAGRRLPTEQEWEYAATIAPDGTKRRHPWGDEPADAGRANLDQRHTGPAEVGAYSPGANPWGVHQLIGDVWEWVSTEFDGYPGFEAFPYREYSEVFFAPRAAHEPGGSYRVLRGGSWATHHTAVRGTFRNWDFPVRRQIFSGFRCARDVEDGAR